MWKTEFWLTAQASLPTFNGRFAVHSPGQGELKRTAGDSLIYHRPYSGDVAGRHQATDRSNVMYDETLSALEDVRAIYVRFQNSRLVVESAIQKARKTAIQDVVNLI